MPSSQFTITISGGNTLDNRRLTNMVGQALREQNFTDIRIDVIDTFRTAESVLDLVRSFNPKFFQTPVRIASDPSDNNYHGAPFDFCAAAESIVALP